MSELKHGQVVYMKTTEEPSVILSLHKSDSNHYHLSGEVATVRRPKQGQDGLTYVVEEFFVEELETKAEHDMRVQEEMQAFRNRLKAQAVSEDSPVFN